QGERIVGLAAEAAHELHPRPEDVEVQARAHAMEQLFVFLHLRRQLRQGLARELEVRDAARRVVADVRVISRLQAVPDALAEELDALCDRPAPGRRKGREA